VTSQHAQLQTLITEIETLLGKATPKLPWVMSGETAQQRRALEQALAYLKQLQQQGRTSSWSGEMAALGADVEIDPRDTEANSQQVLQALLQEMQYLRAQMVQPLTHEVMALQQQRDQLRHELRQLEQTRLQAAEPAAPPQLNPVWVNEVVDQLRSSLMEQLTPQFKALQAQVSTPPALYGTAQDPQETAAELPQLSPQQRLEQLRQIQAQTDHMLLKLDTNLRTVFESMEQSIQSYCDSLNQGLSAMHGLGQQGEVIFRAFINHLAQQLTQDSTYLTSAEEGVARLLEGEDDQFDTYEQPPLHDGDLPTEDLPMDSLIDLDDIDLDAAVDEGEDITLFQLDEDITRLQLDEDVDVEATDDFDFEDEDVTVFQGDDDDDRTVVQMEPIAWQSLVGQSRADASTTPDADADADDDADDLDDSAYAEEIDALYDSLFGEGGSPSRTEQDVETDATADGENALDAGLRNASGAAGMDALDWLGTETAAGAAAPPEEEAAIAPSASPPGDPALSFLLEDTDLSDEGADEGTDEGTEEPDREDADNPLASLLGAAIAEEFAPVQTLSAESDTITSLADLLPAVEGATVQRGAEPAAVEEAGAGDTFIPAPPDENLLDSEGDSTPEDIELTLDEVAMGQLSADLSRLEGLPTEPWATDASLDLGDLSLASTAAFEDEFEPSESGATEADVADADRDIASPEATIAEPDEPTTEPDDDASSLTMEAGDPDEPPLSTADLSEDFSDNFLSDRDEVGTSEAAPAETATDIAELFDDVADQSALPEADATAPDDAIAPLDDLSLDALSFDADPEETTAAESGVAGLFDDASDGSTVAEEASAEADEMSLDALSFEADDAQDTETPADQFVTPELSGFFEDDMPTAGESSWDAEPFSVESPEASPPDTSAIDLFSDAESEDAADSDTEAAFEFGGLFDEEAEAESIFDEDTSDSSAMSFAGADSEGDDEGILPSETDFTWDEDDGDAALSGLFEDVPERDADAPNGDTDLFSTSAPEVTEKDADLFAAEDEEDTASSDPFTLDDTDLFDAGSSATPTEPEPFALSLDILEEMGDRTDEIQPPATDPSAADHAFGDAFDWSVDETSVPSAQEAPEAPVTADSLSLEDIIENLDDGEEEAGLTLDDAFDTDRTDDMSASPPDEDTEFSLDSAFDDDFIGTPTAAAGADAEADAEADAAAMTADSFDFPDAPPTPDREPDVAELGDPELDAVLAGLNMPDAREDEPLSQPRSQDDETATADLTLENEGLFAGEESFSTDETSVTPEDTLDFSLDSLDTDRLPSEDVEAGDRQSAPSEETDDFSLDSLDTDRLPSDDVEAGDRQSEPETASETDFSLSLEGISLDLDLPDDSDPAVEPVSEDAASSHPDDWLIDLNEVDLPDEIPPIPGAEALAELSEWRSDAPSNAPEETFSLGDLDLDLSLDLESAGDSRAPAIADDAVTFDVDDLATDVSSAAPLSVTGEADTGYQVALDDDTLALTLTPTLADIPDADPETLASWSESRPTTPAKPLPDLSSPAFEVAGSPEAGFVLEVDMSSATSELEGALADVPDANVDDFSERRDRPSMPETPQPPTEGLFWEPDAVTAAAAATTFEPGALPFQPDRLTLDDIADFNPGQPWTPDQSAVETRDRDRANALGSDAGLGLTGTPDEGYSLALSAVGLTELLARLFDEASPANRSDREADRSDMPAPETFPDRAAIESDTEIAPTEAGPLSDEELAQLFPPTPLSPESGDASTASADLEDFFSPADETAAAPEIPPTGDEPDFSDEDLALLGEEAFRLLEELGLSQAAADAAPTAATPAPEDRDQAAIAPDSPAAALFDEPLDEAIASEPPNPLDDLDFGQIDTAATDSVERDDLDISDESNAAARLPNDDVELSELEFFADSMTTGELDMELTEDTPTELTDPVVEPPSSREASPETVARETSPPPPRKRIKTPLRQRCRPVQRRCQHRKLLPRSLTSPRRPHPPLPPTRSGFSG